jgi:hypothetical protein
MMDWPELLVAVQVACSVAAIVLIGVAAYLMCK